MSKPLILMYHRIADEPVDYWGLAVSPTHFEEHLSVLRHTRRPLPLTEFVHRLVDGSLPADAVALTFDDGYVDNLTAGLPRLAAADVPATVFLATGYIDRAKPFWWDELADLVLRARGQKRLELDIRGEVLTLEMSSGSLETEDYATPSALKKPHRVLESIYQPMRFVDEEERRATMNKLRSILFERGNRPGSARPMTGDEVRALVACGLVTIGAHTVTHPSLPGLEAAACRHEIAASKHACEALVGATIEAFSYPYGEFNAEVRDAVASAGYAFACSARRVSSPAAPQIFALPRIYVPDTDGDAFEQRIRWASDSG